MINKKVIELFKVIEYKNIYISGTFFLCMGMEYRGRIVVGRSDDDVGVMIFVTRRGGWEEHHSEGIDELVGHVKKIVTGSDYTLNDVQNGATPEDIENCSPYLGCFPPLETPVFDYLIHRLKKKTKIPLITA